MVLWWPKAAPWILSLLRIIASFLFTLHGDAMPKPQFGAHAH